MTKHFLHSIAACIFLFGAGSSRAAAQSARIDVPPVPSNIEVEAGHSVYLKAHAVGTQNYICLATNQGLKWTFVGPQATLFLTFKGEMYQQIATHFLAAYPRWYGPAFASWQHSFDSSQVWGRKLDESDDAAFVEPGAISWLRVGVVGAEPGPAGGSLLTQTTFIQRLNTSGGRAPGVDCSQVGALAMMPYTADYFFYRADRDK